ncbi:MAG: hypothetical protein GY944_25430 [bacterium]|nr:hypothetical protein [bacterium]
MQCCALGTPEALRSQAMTPGRRSVFACCLALTLACSSQNTPREHSEAAPVFVIAVDGFEWELVLPLLREGEMPQTAALMARGTFGTLETLLPTESPAIWTTVATGKHPAGHGIAGFVNPARAGTENELFNNRDRTTKAIWNIVSDAAKRVAVVGWWMSYPVEEINGVMIAQTNTAETFRKQFKMPWKGTLKRDVSGQVHPPEREDEFLAFLPAIHDGLEASLEQIFGLFPEPLSPAERTIWTKGSWSARADITYRKLALHLLERDDPYDLFIVYFGGTDTYTHRYWRYLEPERFPLPQSPRAVRNLGNVVRDYYRYIDRTLGELVAHAGPDARIFVVADHGMHPIREDDAEGRRRNPNYSDHKDAPPGVFIAAGPGIAVSPRAQLPPAALHKDDMPRLGHVVDITPTVLALMGLAVGEDMDGQVMSDVVAPAFFAGRPVERVATHDSHAWLSERASQSRSAPGQEERFEQLRALGYLVDDK